MTITLNRKNTVFYYIAITVIGILLAVFYFNSINVNSTAKWMDHSQIVINKNNEILLDIINIETGARGFVLTNNEDFLEPYKVSVKQINQNINTLLLLTKDNVNQQIRVKKLKKSIAERINLSKSLIDTNNKEDKLATIIEGKAVMDVIRQDIKTINLEELSLLKQRTNNNGFSAQMSNYLLYALFFLLLVLVFFIYYLFKNHKKRNSELESFNINQKEASQYSRSLIEASLDPLVTISAEGKITDVNYASIKVTGVEREKLVGTDFSNYFTDPKKAREGYRQVFENGYVENYPLTIKHINGKLIDVLYNASVYKNDNNEVLGVFAAARDVTEQKKVENVLKESEEKFKLIFEKSTAPIIIADDKGNYLEVNKAAAEIFEYSINELMGMNVGDLITTSNPNAAAQYEEYINKGEEIGEFGFISKKGTPKIVQYQAVRIKPDYNLSILMDVTAQKQSSQYARSLIEASLDPLVTISPEGKITDVNNASIKVTGIEREKLVGTDFSNYFTDPKKAQEGYRQAFENGFVEDYPLTIKHISGKLTDVLYNASVYKDDNNNVLGVFAAARDITEQNKQKLKSDIANKSLETSNNSLKLASQYSLGLIESSPDPMFVISPDGKITDTNQASIKVTDVSKENLMGSNFITYFTEPEKAKKGYEAVFSKGFVVDYPLTIKDGQLTPVLFNGSVYKDENANIVGAIVVARDISEQKKAEKKLLQSLKEVTDYKLALDASTIVDITDKNGNILFVNENYVSISKYSYDELIGGNHTIVNSRFHRKEFMKTLWNTISQGKIWQGEIKNVNKDGQHYWLYMTIVPFLDEEEIPYQYVAISIDITNQKNSETQLTEAKVFAELATEIAEQAQNKAESATKIAENAVKAKQQFLSNMSHEIRTPMNAIIGFTTVALKTDLSAKQREYLSAIKMSGDALIVLINDILDLAKVDAGKMVFEKVPFKLQQSIKAMLHVFETKIQESNLKLVTQYDKNIPKVLLGDPVRLHQIILNLVSNAVKFTTNGTITVSVKLLKEDDEKATVEFEVADTGIGISEEKLGGIFENFQQASSNTSRLYGGTGLGLAIVKQLVEPQGGTITVKSKVNEGSNFSFILDFPKTNIEAEIQTEIIEIDPENKNIKVLVVEDMDLNQLLMKTILDDFGFERDIAENGKIAIDKLKTKSYDIVLMDLQMPIMNGFEATNYIRKVMNSKIPIIALTADVTTVDLTKCKAVGMDDYIAKPVDERLLYSKIIGLVKKPALDKRTKPDLNKIAPTEEVKCIDLNYLSQRTKANPKLMMEMISLYLAQTPPIISAMKKSLRDNDFELLHASMHKMIPSFAIMGINSDFEDIARKMQDYDGSQQYKEEIDAMALELEVVCDQASKELEIEYKLLKNTIP